MKNQTSIGCAPVVSFLLFLVAKLTYPELSHAKCEIKMNEDASKIFRELLQFHPQLIEFHLRFNGLKVTNLTRPIHFDELSNPTLWHWIISRHEWLVNNHFYYDSDIFTLGLINNYVRSMNVTFEVPDICRTTELDRKELFRQVYGNLEQMVMVNKSFQSLLCYEVNLCRSLSLSAPAKYRTARYFGMMRYVHTRRCCDINWHKATNISNVPWDCALYRKYKQLDFINIIGTIIFAFSPLFILKLFAVRTQKWILLDNGSFQELSDGHIDWLNPEETFSIFWTILRIRTSKRFTCFMRSFFRIAFVLFTPIVLYVMLTVYYLNKYHQLLIYLKEGLPLGYLSIMFGFRRSFENTDGFVGGPIVSLFTYCSVGFILISIPTSVPNALSSHIIRQSQSCTFLQVDIDFLEKYGSVGVRGLYDFERVYGIIKARLLMSINPSFWAELVSVWLSRMLRLTDYLQATLPLSNQVVWFLLLVLAGIILVIPCLLEACLCILYYSVPISFIFFTVPKGYLVSYVLPRIRSHQVQTCFTGIILAICIVGGFHFFYCYSLYVFCVSFFIVSRFVIQTFSVVILNPEYSMYLVSIVFCFYYTYDLGRQVIINYRQLLSISIQIVEKAQSEERIFIFDRPFVLVSYASDKYIRSDIFSEIIRKHFPLRYELAWACGKASVVLFFLVLSLDILFISNTQALAFPKSVWVFFTACLPKLLNVIHQRHFRIANLEEIIYRILQTSN